MAFISRLRAHGRPERLGGLAYLLVLVLVPVLVLVLVPVFVLVLVFGLTRIRRTDAPRLSCDAVCFASAPA